MKVALYLRMSTDKQDASIPQQRAALERHAAQKGYSIVAEYLDEGISGDATRKRKGFQKMIADAPAGDFDRILCFDQDRFGRFDMIEAGLWISPLRDAGVTLETIAQGEIDWNDFAGRLTYAVAQEGKHQFLRDLSRNCLRGQVAKAKTAEGMYGGPAPYGYQRVSTLDGRRRITSLVPDKFEAAIVRRIFETYTGTSGSLLAVGEMLNGEKIVAPYGRGPWHRNAVRRILRNRTYIGDYVWGSTNSGKYHTRAGDDVVARRRGDTKVSAADPIVHEGILPALVSRELFDKAQELLDARRKATRRPGSVRPLSGLITCAQCGSPMHVNFGDYRCSRSTDFGNGRRCDVPIARGPHLLQAIAEQLQTTVLAPKKLTGLKKKLEQLAQAEQRAAGSGSTAGLDRQIAEIDRQIAEGIARIPLLPKTLVPDMAKGLDSLRAQRDTLKRQRASMSKAKAGSRLPIHNRIDAALAALYRFPKSLAEGDPAVVNEDLRNMGLRVLVHRGRAQVVIDPLQPIAAAAKPGRKPAASRNTAATARDKSPGPYLVAFEVPMPVEPLPRGRARAG